MDRILFMSRKYPPSTGGMELFAYELATSLQQQSAVKVITWGGSNKMLPLVLPWLWLQGLLELLKGNVSVIQAQDGIMSAPVWLLAKLFHKPYSVVLHGLDITHKNPLYQAVIPWFVRRAGVVICISTATAEEAAKRGVAQEKIRTIPLAVNDSLYGKSDRQRLLHALGVDSDCVVLLTVGRLVRRKGVAWFIRNVLPELVAHYPKLIYVVVGKGGMQAAIEAAVTETNMADHVRLLGRVQDELYEAAYNGADVFVMPNIQVAGDMEGFGLVLLEASLCARPIVASNLEGIADAVTDGKNAVLVESEDVAGFVTQIRAFLDNPTHAAQFGRQSREFTLEHYQWPKIAKQFLSYVQPLWKKR